MSKKLAILFGTEHVRMHNKKNKDRYLGLRNLSVMLHKSAFWQVQKQAETLSPRSPKSPRSPALSARVRGPWGVEVQGMEGMVAVGSSLLHQNQLVHRGQIPGIPQKEYSGAKGVIFRYLERNMCFAPKEMSFYPRYVFE